MSWYNNIGVKIVLLVVATTLLVDGLFAYLYLTIQEKQMNQIILRNCSQLCETIKQSIKLDMLENRKENAYRIMETIGQQEGIEKVRIYSKEGRIIFSTDRGEGGGMVNKRAEACTACHSEAHPLVKLTTSERGRIFTPGDPGKAVGNGNRVLGMINPMYNEKECSSAACHAHPETQKVLGVIDVTMSLADVDRDIAAARTKFVLFNALSIFAVSSILVIVLLRFVERPVKELVLGTRRVAEGDLYHVIPIVTNDEMGHLAQSFNAMTEKLRHANAEIQEWIRGLEDKVEERSRELRDTQVKLLHSEKLVAMGKLAATVAHEINNPLTGVFTYIKLMERKIEQGQIEPQHITVYQGYLATMRREVERTTAIVRNLLDFTRPKEPSRKPTDLARLIDESLGLLQNQFRLNNITVENRVQSLPEVQADPAQIKQVFINLMVNACEAMEGGGVLAIRSEVENSGEEVSVVFSDTGVGIDPEHLTRVFDPFFSTKEKGTGLGLAVVHGIITRHDGKIDIQSRPGHGTRIRVALPIG